MQEEGFVLSSISSLSTRLVRIENVEPGWVCGLTKEQVDQA